MNYEKIPSYNELFFEDQYEFKLSLDFNRIAYVLSFLGYLYTEKDTMNKTFLEESVGVKGIDRAMAKEYLEDKVLITQLGVLNAWKLGFKCLNQDPEENYSSADVLFNTLYRIIIKKQEEDIDKIGDVSVKNSLMTIGILDYLDNQASEFKRSFYMFISNKDRFSVDPKYIGYKDLFEKFESKYGISLEAYMKGLYVLVFYKCQHNYEQLIITRNMTKYNFVIDPAQIQSQETRDNIIKVLENLSIDFETSKKWAKEAELETFNFKLFMEKPIYKINENCYLPICRKFLQDQLFHSLIYKIRNLYEESDMKFFHLLGLLFEDYAVYIFEQVIIRSEIKYTIIKEFEYSVGKKEHKSSDLIVCWENDVYVFECKSARVLNSIYKILNQREIEQSIEKVIKKPISQAITRMNEIVNLGINEELNNKKNYYFISVTVSNFPDHFSNFDQLLNQIKSSEIKIAGCFNFSIEEYELLCDVLVQNNKALNYYLNDYKYNTPDHYSFKNYINQFNVKSVVFEDIEKKVEAFEESIDL